MSVDLWAEPCSTLAFWGYVFLCVAAVWYWSYAGLFENRKKLFLSASVLGGVLYLLASYLLKELLYPAWLFLCTAACLHALARWRKISFSRQEYLVGAVLSLLVDAVLAVIPLSIWLSAIGLK